MGLLIPTLPWTNNTTTSNNTMTSRNSTLTTPNESTAPTKVAKDLSQSQDLAIEVIERIGSSISMACVLFLMSTFICYRRLRKPSNTLLFSASPANFFAGIASLIGRAGLSRPNAATCQVQGFFLEWFMQADAYWVCAGAANVFLVFLFRYNAEQLRRLYPLCWVICYGIPAIPATFSLIYRQNGKHMYGDATLWCWYSNDYMMSRLYAYYIPIWVVVTLAMLLYILVGLKIHRNNVLLSSLQSTPLSNACSRTFEYSVSYSLAPNRWPIPGEATNPTAPPSSTSVTITAPPPPSPPRFPLLRHLFTITPATPPTLSPSDRSTNAYSRVAFLFFASNLITWVPASINRVYSIYHPETPSFVLNVAAAIVLPLQGLWNCVIYVIVNRPLLVGIFAEWRRKVSGEGEERSEDVEMEGLKGRARNAESGESDDDGKLQGLREALEYTR